MNVPTEHELQAKCWPYFVLICEGCDQIGMMRFRRLRDAKEASRIMYRETGLVGLVWGLVRKGIAYDPRKDTSVRDPIPEDYVSSAEAMSPHDDDVPF